MPTHTHNKNTYCKISSGKIAPTTKKQAKIGFYNYEELLSYPALAYLLHQYLIMTSNSLKYTNKTSVYHTKIVVDRNFDGVNLPLGKKSLQLSITE